MNDKEANIQVRRLRSLGRKWFRPIGLTSWFTIHVIYDRNELPAGKNGSHITASAWSDYRYQEAEIIFNLPRCARLSEEELELAVVHEAVHLPLKRLQISMPDNSDTLDRIEETTTQISRMLILARAAGEREAKTKPKRRMKCRRT